MRAWTTWWLLDVELPRRIAREPIIDGRELARLGVHSAPRFRAYIAARSVTWRSGKTRFSTADPAINRLTADAEPFGQLRLRHALL